MPWYSTKEAAKLLGRVERTIRRMIKQKTILYQVIHSNKGGGAAGKAYEVWIDDETISNFYSENNILMGADTDKGADTVRTQCGQNENKCQIKCHTMTAVKAQATKNKKLISADTVRTQCGQGADTLEKGLTIKNREKNSQCGQGADITKNNFQTHAEVRTFCNDSKLEISSEQKEKVLLKCDLVRHFIGNGKNEDWVNAYNTGNLLPGIYKVVGKVSKRTLLRWDKKLKNAKMDWHILADNRGAEKKSYNRILSEKEKNLLLSILLHQNRVKIATGIKMVMERLEKKGETTASESTYRRFVNEYKKKNYDTWVLCREGEKALKDKVVKYINRDSSLLEVGDVLVADGHKLNFDIINPYTGKAKRMILILYFDWASRMPLGCSIMPTENIQAIHAALRAAILNLGKMPKVAYLDNGAAFKSKFFTEDIDFEESGIGGLYGKLGVHVTFAKPYNAKAKVVERYFNTFNEHFERFVQSYTGQSILDKPASMMRNETWMAKLFKREALEISEAMQLIDQAILDYGNRNHGGLKGKYEGMKPLEILSQGRGEGIDASALDELMMAQEIRQIRNNGIRLFGVEYYAPELYGINDKCIIKYDFSDMKKVKVFSIEGEFLAEAKMNEELHPMLHLSENKEIDKYKLDQAIKLQQRQVKESKQRALKELDSVNSGLSNWLLEGSTANLKAIEESEEDKIEVFETSFPGQIKMYEKTESDFEENEVAETLGDEPIFYSEMEKFEYLVKRYKTGEITEEEERELEHYKKTTTWWEDFYDTI